MAKTKDVEKGKCKITRKDFQNKAKAFSVKIGKTEMVADVKEFSTGSFGFYAGGKAIVEIDGTPVECQVTCSITVPHSKEQED